MKDFTGERKKTNQIKVRVCLFVCLYESYIALESAFSRVSKSKAWSRHAKIIPSPGERCNTETVDLVEYEINLANDHVLY